MPLPSVHQDNNPFNTWMRWAAPAAAIIAIPLVIFFQQFSRGLHGATLQNAPREVLEREEAEEPGVGELAVMSKILVKLAYLASTLSQPPAAAHGGWLEPEQSQELKELLNEIDASALSRVDRFRAAIVAGELQGAKVAVERLEKLAAEADPTGGLASETSWLLGWYRPLAAGKKAELPLEVQQSLIDRHGWFGRLALSYGKDASDTERWEIISGGKKFAAFITGYYAWSGLSLVAGAIILIVMLVKTGQGEIELSMYETGVPGSVYLEMFAVWALSFLFLLMVGVLLIGQTGTWATVVNEILLWSLIVPCFWPLFRGVSWEDFKIDLGLETGGNFAKEIGAGIVGFLAGAPMVALVSYFASRIESSMSEAAEGASAVPMFEHPLGSSWFAVWIDAMSAVLWAPVIEEMIFRGALHKYLPGSLRIMGRVAITALIFGIYHPYSASGLVSVAAGGVVFGLLREWRGSLIAPMTAHFLHNASITLLSVGILAILG